MDDRKKRNRRTKTLDIVKAGIEDLPRIMEIYASARRRMADTGNPNQWNNGYPEEALLTEDIHKGELYKVIDGSVIVGAFDLVPGPNEVYSRIDGAWLNEEPYLVIHRIASKGARGVANEAFRWVMEQTDNLRIDTHDDNAVMRHILEKEDFIYVGELTLPNGDARRAYHLTKNKG